MLKQVLNRSIPGAVWLPSMGLLVVASALLLAVVILRPGAASNEANSPSALAPDGTLRQPVHWHADFAVVINGERFDFNKPEFISKEGQEGNAWVHIHEPRPTVVHVHREQTTWDEFMRSLGFSLTDAALTLPDGRKFVTGDLSQLKFYVNGVRIDTLMFESISDLSQVLVTFGPESDAEIRRSQLPMITDQACIPSELCRDRIPDVPEPEPCTKSGTACTG